jgi:hypothetical protein
MKFLVTAEKAPFFKKRVNRRVSNIYCETVLSEISKRLEWSDNVFTTAM